MSLCSPFQKELRCVLEINKKKSLSRWEESMMPLVKIILTNYDQMKQLKRNSTSADFRAQKKLLMLKLETFAKHRRVDQSHQTDQTDRSIKDLTERIDTPLLDFETVLEPDDYENRPVHQFNALNSWELDRQIEEYFHRRDVDQEKEILEFYLCSVE